MKIDLIFHLRYLCSHIISSKMHVIDTRAITIKIASLIKFKSKASTSTESKLIAFQKLLYLFH